MRWISMHYDGLGFIHPFIFIYFGKYALLTLHWLFSCIQLGLGLGDLLKPDLIMPLMATLPLEQRLAPYLPEVHTNVVIWLYSNVVIEFLVIHAIFFDVGYLVSRRYIGVVAEPTFPPASRFIYICKGCSTSFFQFSISFQKLLGVIIYLFIYSTGASNRTDWFVSVWNWSK